MQETKTNFYLPIPFVILPPSISGGGSATTGEDSSDAYHNTIYITGHPDAIQEASERYLELAKSVVRDIFHLFDTCFTEESRNLQASTLPSPQIGLAL